jgi:DNA-binding LacI/PurR family transcriptional regulator
VPTVVVTWRTDGIPGLDSVAGNDLDGARLAVDHLFSLGHERIVHISGGDNRIARERRAGYESAMEAHALTPLVVEGAFTEAGGYAGAVAAVDAGATALVVANDLAAIGVLAALRGRGLRVPDDMSVVGYDGMRLLDSLDLTTVAQPLADMGRVAADLLMERIARPDRVSLHHQVETRLVARGSTARLR